MVFQRVKNTLCPDVTAFDPAFSDQIDHSLLENCKPHHREAIKLAMFDLYGKRMEALISLPFSWEAHINNVLLKDKRDYPLLLTFIQCFLWITFSSIVQIFILPQSGWGYLWLLVHLPVTWVVLAERFILAMHYAAHRPLFNERGQFSRLAWCINSIPQIVLSNFWGMPSGAYYLHHIVMHHNVSAHPLQEPTRPGAQKPGSPDSLSPRRIEISPY